MYEYKVVSLSNLDDSEERLNEYSQDSWRLIQIVKVDDSVGVTYDLFLERDLSEAR